MKKLIFLSISLLFITQNILAQNPLESNPSLSGVTIGDDFSKWKNSLEFNDKDGVFDIYDYTNEFKIGGFIANRVRVVSINSTNKIGSLNIYMQMIWTQKKEALILHNIKLLFGEPQEKQESNYETKYTWESDSYLLFLVCDISDSNPALYQQDVTIYLTSKVILDKKISSQY